MLEMSQNSKHYKADEIATKERNRRFDFPLAQGAGIEEARVLQGKACYLATCMLVEPA